MAFRGNERSRAIASSVGSRNEFDQGVDPRSATTVVSGVEQKRQLWGIEVVSLS
ncbi:hypothetical protein D9M70_428260 [compost metagenome]